MSNKTNNLKAYLRDLYEGIVSKKPDASRNPQNFRSEIEAIRTGGELYEVMDASELPEDAPNGSLALVEGEPIPEAYTVSSVDELPTNAVDGSMAIVDSDSLIGEWEWKDNQSPLDLSMFNIPIGGGVNYVRICVEDNYTIGFYGYFSLNNLGGDLKIDIGHNPLYAYGAFDDSYDRFHLYSEVDEEKSSLPHITVDQFKQFIKTNCNRLSGGYSLYTHENGEWVYKCEVA